jgi:hypothetical protein
MSNGTRRVEYGRLRTPAADRTALIEPPWKVIPELLASNAAHLASGTYDFHGVSLQQLAQEARRDVVAEALRWTRRYSPTPYADAASIDPAAPVLLAGHQPQLFHPGVWYKNFALSALAARHRATAVNLIVDSDTIKTAELRVPGGSVGSPYASMVAMDQPGPVVPFEERRILDPGLFASFGERALRQIGPLVADPLLREFWPLAVAQSRQTNNLGQAIAQSRHQWEYRWGLRTLEVPQSWVCRTRSFARFSVHLLAELPRLLAAYNHAVHEYRRLHRLRSASHPVPNLAVDRSWFESPYWIWTADDPRRRRLFVRRERDRMLLSDRASHEFAIPMGESVDIEATVDAWMALADRGVRLRSRALITTLFARLLSGDLFIHGIGGAKYDQVTNTLIERFFGLVSPGFLVLSATVRLPIAFDPPPPDAVRKIDQALRELTFHPERSLRADSQGAAVRRATDAPNGATASGGEPWRELVDAKQRWIRTLQTPENAHTRWECLQRINAQLQPWIAAERDQGLRQRAETVRAMRNAEILGWREYAFCLYPAEMLQNTLKGLLPNDA